MACDFLAGIKKYVAKEIIEADGRFEYKGHILDDPDEKGVYLVWDRQGNEERALKVLWSTQLSKQRAEQEWLVWSEVNARGLLKDNNHVLRLYQGPVDLKVAWGTLMEKGEYSLENLLKVQAFRPSEEQAVDIIREIALGVQPAHIAGYSHNDLKPLNVIIVKVTGQLHLFKVGDFANSTQGSHPTSTAKGTVGYMAPEGLKVTDGTPRYDVRSDIYSLGVILYQLSHPKVETPFERLQSMELYDRQMGPKFVEKKLSELKITGWIKDIILKAVQPKPDHRHQSVQEFLYELEGKKKLKPVSDIQAYQQFNETYQKILNIFAASDLRTNTAFGNVKLEYIDGIHTGLDGLQHLEEILRKTDLTGYPPGVISEIEQKRKHARDTHNSLASEDYELLKRIIDPIQKSITSDDQKQKLESQKELAKIRDDLWELIFLWGPPLSIPQKERATYGWKSKERYTLAEIRAGKHKEDRDGDPSAPKEKGRLAQHAKRFKS